MYYEDMMKMSDDELLEQLLISGTPGAHDYELCERELHRRYLNRLEKAVNRVDASSHRLERLTLALIVLTIALILLAAPPAWEILFRR